MAVPPRGINQPRRQTMKAMITLTAVAALIAGISLASEQNMGGSASPNASPSNINKGDDSSTKAGAQSGSESSGTAKQAGAMKNRVTGTGKFCIQVSKSGGGIECRFANLATCTKEAQPRGLQCSQNPNMGTTGAK
jgi:hypothetical protein